ncbi:PQQ-dependent sugar dehydrogenase [uncultured Tateyamaria sp.]|uniref:PQQ-dependent sugar dehydrogenase n=1 Tax=uncultured Tateyamaria sp. TaxID=455651 RepID=UPI00261DA9A4|nr:PQQ-dependent sugar dehydrogenase [uncultured Tateyamaria sp.]
MRRFAVLAFALLPTGALALETEQGAVSVSAIVSGLDQPWGVAETPDGALLITQRGGQLILVQDGQARQVRGTPRVAAQGQGGLLDITLARDFAESRTLFLTYSKPQGGGSGTALAAAELSADGTRLENLRDLFESAPGGTTGRHFGSRVVEASDGTLFVTIGDRGDRPSAQDRSNHNGAIVRVNRDGSVPADNPFLGQDGIQPHIWSYGHRNPQGAGLDGRGTLWTAEHGARGGDEVNRVRKGANFGWPVISYGVHYSGATIGQGQSQEGMEQPAFYWDPSMAPSGLMIYQGGMFPEWQGDMFVGSLKFSYISRLAIDGITARELEQIEGDETLRVRDIVEAPDGSILFISVGNGAVYRMTR